jgi:hypothetical protein
VLLAALPPSIAPGVAQAWSGPGDGVGALTPATPHVVVFGKVVSVDATAGTFVANTAVMPMRSEPGDGPGDSGHGFTGGGFTGTSGFLSFRR